MTYTYKGKDYHLLESDYVGDVLLKQQDGSWVPAVIYKPAVCDSEVTYVREATDFFNKFTGESDE